MSKDGASTGSGKAKGVLEAQAEGWEGPHFRLSFCGVDRDGGAAPPRELFGNAAEPVGCWEYVLSGAMYYKAGTERYRVNAGEALVAARGEAGWQVRAISGPAVQTMWLMVQGEPALEMYNYLRMKYGLIQPFGLQSRVVRLARQLIEAVRAKPRRAAHEWSEKTFLWLNGWWEHAQEHHVSWNREPLEVLKPASLALQTPQTVKGFAAQMGYSRSYLTRKLTAQWSASPGAVLRRVRLEKAAELLGSKPLSIAEIAGQVGYGTSAAFGRAFVQVYGQTPRAYRQSRRQVVDDGRPAARAGGKTRI